MEYGERNEQEISIEFDRLYEGIVKDFESFNDRFEISPVKESDIPLIPNLWDIHSIIPQDLPDSKKFEKKTFFYKDYKINYSEVLRETTEPFCADRQESQ